MTAEEQAVVSAAIMLLAKEEKPLDADDVEAQLDVLFSATRAGSFLIESLMGGTTQMSKDRQEQLSHTGDSSGWDLAIARAEREIATAEDRIGKLRLSIGSFMDFKRRGEPWPGTSESETEDMSQTGLLGQSRKYEQ